MNEPFVSIELSLSDARDLLASLRYPGVHTGDPIVLAMVELYVARAEHGAEIAAVERALAMLPNVEVANIEPTYEVGANHNDEGFAYGQVDGREFYDATETRHAWDWKFGVRAFDPTDQDPT